MTLTKVLQLPQETIESRCDNFVILVPGHFRAPSPIGQRIINCLFLNAGHLAGEVDDLLDSSNPGGKPMPKWDALS